MKLLSADGKREHIFMHLSQSKAEGKSFKQGDVIANSGGEMRDFEYTDKDGKTIKIPKEKDMRSGNAKGAHLHWGIKVNGQPVDPLTFVK
jgi:septal ring factor EnvC (AmiA/AmiB activator)